MERFRGSSEIPLTAEGLQAAHELGQQLAVKGGLDELRTSSLGRTVNTARIISRYTHAPITDITDSLHPWHVGLLEGKEITPERAAELNRLTRDSPDEVIPGRGPVSTADGESFNDFKSRTLPYLQKVMHLSATDPQRRIGIVTHYRVKKLLDAWMRKGAQPDGEIDGDEMIRHSTDNNPGGIERLVMNPYGGPEMTRLDLKSPQQLQGGIYLIRHEMTPWNEGSGS